MAPLGEKSDPPKFARQIYSATKGTLDSKFRRFAISSKVPERYGIARSLRGFPPSPAGPTCSLGASRDRSDILGSSLYFATRRPKPKKKTHIYICASSGTSPDKCSDTRSVLHRTLSLAGQAPSPVAAGCSQLVPMACTAKMGLESSCCDETAAWSSEPTQFRQQICFPRLESCGLCLGCEVCGGE